jgi:Dopey, N-terminal
MDIMDQVRLVSSGEESFFWQNFWLSMATSIELRLAGLNYCLKRMDPLNSGSKYARVHVSNQDR